MRLQEFLRPELIKLDVEARDKQETIEELIDLLITEHEIRIRERGAVLKAVLEREESMSTGIEHGVAIPHGATEVVDDLVGALAISQGGVSFESCDGEPATLILLLVIPKTTFQQHVKTLAGVAKLMSDPELRQAILESKTPEKAMETIETYENKEFLYDFK